MQHANQPSLGDIMKQDVAHVAPACMLADPHISSLLERVGLKMVKETWHQQKQSREEKSALETRLQMVLDSATRPLRFDRAKLSRQIIAAASLPTRNP